MTTRNLTIVFTDIKGFTARVSAGSRDDLRRLRDEHDRLLAPVFRYFHGKVVKSIGDAFLVTFESPTDAVLCGVTIQEVLRQHNSNRSAGERLEVRVAINAGEVSVSSDGDVLGEPVNIAARLEAVAEPGQVFFTEAVYLAMNRREAPSAELGEYTFKGIPYPVRVYKVLSEPESELANRVSQGVRLTANGPVLHGLAEEPVRRNRTRLGLWIGAAVLTLVISAALLWQMHAASQALHDARTTAESLLLQPAQQQDSTVLQQLLARYPDNANVPYAAGQVLEQAASPLYALLMYEAALQRGYQDAKLPILAYCFAVFARHTPEGGAKVAHRLLRTHFDAERTAWARQTLATTDNGLLLTHAWTILQEKNDPLLTQPPAGLLYDLLDGYEDETQANQAVSTFAAIADATQRQRILALHRWLLNPDVPWFWRHKDLIERNLGTLEQQWHAG